MAVFFLDFLGGLCAHEKIGKVVTAALLRYKSS
jgi:hypothetical protein